MVCVIMKENLLKVGRGTEKRGAIRRGIGIEIGRETEAVIRREVRTGTGTGIGTGTGTGTVIIEIAMWIEIAVREGNGAGREMMTITIEVGTMTGSK